MIDFDVDGLESLVWVYGTQEGIITPITWEKIISKSVYGEHIPGDVFMADGKKNNFGLNIKSLLKSFTKGDVQTCSFVQCRCPLDENENIGKGVIKTLVEKREESFKEFNLDTMIDVIILHNRSGEDYNVRVFVEKQDEYENLNFSWYDSRAYLNPNKTNNNWEKNWKLKRIPGNASAFQTCVNVKKTFNINECIANFTVKCYDNYDVTIEEAKRRYAEVQ